MRQTEDFVWPHRDVIERVHLGVRAAGAPARHRLHREGASSVPAGRRNMRSLRMSKFVRTMLAVAAVIAITTPAFAGEVTGVTVSPTTLSIQEGSSGTYKVAVTSI